MDRVIICIAFSPDNMPEDGRPVFVEAVEVKPPGSLKGVGPFYLHRDFEYPDLFRISHCSGLSVYSDDHERAEKEGPLNQEEIVGLFRAIFKGVSAEQFNEKLKKFSREQGHLTELNLEAEDFKEADSGHKGT